MHYSNLNKGSNKDDEFRPADFLDLDSGDSDNEILAKFKNEADPGKAYNNSLKPISPLKQF